MTEIQVVADKGSALTGEQVRAALEAGLGRGRYAGQRVLVLIPDHTRTFPLPELFRALVDVLREARRLDFMVALGTHPALSEEALAALVGLTPAEKADRYPQVGLLNHRWDDPGALVEIGTIPQAQVRAIAGDVWHPSLGGDVPVRVNRAVMDYDEVVIVGPVFPHEVVGFSGGAKYVFPGISGAEMINVTHWLGALITILQTIGIAETPVRALIHAAAELLPVPLLLVAGVVEGEALTGLFIGDHISAWRAAADLSARRHIIWVDRPFQRVLSCAPPMYDELWTAAKAMYKLEPAVADGGEIVVYAPHLSVVSHVHGRYIYQVGYHVRDYFLKQWERFKDVPAGVLAHSTHFRGSGRFEGGVERPRIKVTLASQLSPADCERLALGYCDPREIDPAAWQGREAEGILYVPKAGEMLYRLK
ncbi:MAG: lactate racemase domain-containing protein [Anaerolineae bacterium]